jgi:hypothetical protein
MINEHKKGVKAIKYNAKPRNFVAKNAGATTSGAGAHKDKKKAMKQGEIKHKAKELAESVPYDKKLDFLLKAAVIKDKIRESVTTEGAKVDRQAKHITASMMKKGKSKKDAEAIAWAHIKHPKKKKTNEGIEPDNAEYNDEAGMARGSLKTMHRAVIGLAKTISEGDNLPEWCQEKLSLAEDYLVTVWDYLQSEQDVAENSNPPTKRPAPVGAPKTDEKYLAYLAQRKAAKQKEQGVAEAGYGRNRRYTQGFASPDAPSLGGNKYDSDGNQIGGGHDEYPNGGNQPMNFDRPQIVAWWFFDVPPDREEEARAYDIKKTKSGKYGMPQYDKSDRSFALRMNTATQKFGKPKKWVPKQ